MAIWFLDVRKKVFVTLEIWHHLKAQYLIHPGRSTWNLQITHLERNMIFQTSIIVFHVNLPGCRNQHLPNLFCLKQVPEGVSSQPSVSLHPGILTACRKRGPWMKIFFPCGTRGILPLSMLAYLQVLSAKRTDHMSTLLCTLKSVLKTIIPTSIP